MFTVKRIVWIVVVLLIVGGLWMLSRPRPVPVDVGRVTRGPIRAFVEEEGRTRVIDRYVISAPVSGRLLRIDLEPGDPVVGGAIAARIDAIHLESAVREAEARVRALREQVTGVGTKKPKPEEIERARILEDQASQAFEVSERELDRARAEWSRLEKDLVRIKDLASDELVPDSELDAAVAAETAALEQVRAQEVRVKIARLAISAAGLSRRVLEDRIGDFDWEAKAYEQQISGMEASLEALRDDLKRTEISAPVSGVVLRVFQESEQVVAAGTPLLEVGDLRKLEVEVDYLSEDASHMRKGMKAEIFGRALGNRVIEGRIERIHPSAFEKISSLGVEQQRVYVIVAFDAADSGLRDRFRVEVRVILEEKEDVVLVPEGALFRHEGAWHVFVVKGKEVHLTRVSTGVRDGRAREVLEGLEEGQVVVMHPGDALEDRADVKILQ